MNTPSIRFSCHHRLCAACTSIALLACAPSVWAADDNIQSNTQDNDEDVLVLDDVEVNASDDSDLSTISTKKLLRVPGIGDDPLKAIQSLPGVVQGNGRTGAPAVRGASPRDNEYIIDFMPVGNIFHNDTSSILNVNTIEDFTLEAAAFPARYSNANAAVLNANSRSPYYDQRQAVIDVSPIKASILLETPITENQSAYFSARKSLFQYYLKYLLKPEGINFTTFPQYDDYQGKYEYRVNDTDTLSVNLLGSHDEIGLFIDGDADAAKQNPGLAGKFGIDQAFHSQSIVWEKLYDNGSTHTLGFSHLNQTFDLRFGKLFFIDVNTHSYNLRSVVTHPISYEHELEWGIRYSFSTTDLSGKVNLKPNDEYTPDEPLTNRGDIIDSSSTINTNTVSVHLQDTWDVTQSVTIVPGTVVSHDDYTKQTFIEPRFKARWNFTDDWWVNTAYGKHHQFSPNGGAYAKDFGNPKLKQPTSTHYLVGLENKLSDSLLWKVDVYYKDMDDIIIARPDEDKFKTLPRYVNEATGKAWGAEFFLNKNLTSSWYGWMSLAYSHTERTNKLTNKNFLYNYDKPIVFNLVSAYKLNQKWTLGIKWRLESGQLYTPLKSATFVPADGEKPSYYMPIYGEINSDRLPVNHKMDLRLDRKYQFNNWDMDLYIEVLNVYSRQNVLGYEYEDEKYEKRIEVNDLPLIAIFGLKFTI